MDIHRTWISERDPERTKQTACKNFLHDYLQSELGRELTRPTMFTPVMRFERFPQDFSMPGLDSRVQVQIS